MDGADFLAAVQSDQATALDRLGSERALVAVTGAAIDRSTVLDRSLKAEARAAATFEAWADDEDVAIARTAFEDAASLEREHLARIQSLDGETPTGGDGGAQDGQAIEVDGSRDPEPDALHQYLRGLDETAERVGAGLVGRPLVASRTLLQVINFFVNEGDTTAAECFRELRRETDEQAAAGAALFVDVTDDAADRDRARESAISAIEVAYEEYVEQLTDMGVDPKPVC